jgi:CheY-like chemotaxis protein/DNA-directed RNA polymerase specialized sigma24 family protein
MGWYENERAFVRQFARAVTADRFLGDKIVQVALADFDPHSVSATTDWERRLAVFRAFFDAWERARNGMGPENSPDRALLASAPQRSSPARQLLLLVDVLGLTPGNAAELLRLDKGEAARLLSEEREYIHHSVQGSALVVEDEFVIALDVASALEGMGLGIIGIARTKPQAVAMARRHMPDLMLVDYDLGGGASGLDAVKEVSAEMPVIAIFLTAFPDDVLAGEEHEPAFVLSKPFRERALRAAVVHGLETTRPALAQGGAV